MHLHYCGNVFHDVFMNMLTLISVAPDWLPYASVVRSWARRKR